MRQGDRFPRIGSSVRTLFIASWCPDAVTTPLTCPRPPEPGEAPPFPVLASVAPVVASVAIWAITRSPFALVFALLGPVVAVASLGDARRLLRRRRREEQSRFDRELAVARIAVDRAHEREREGLRLRAPTAGDLVARQHRDPERWMGGLGREVPVTLGLGATASDIVFDAEPLATPEGQAERALQRLRSRAATLTDAPVVVDGRLGIGVCGPAPKAVAAAAAILIQFARTLPPDGVELRAPARLPRGLDWVTVLPHWVATASAEIALATGAAARFDFTARSGAGERVFVAVAEEERDLPGDCRVIVRLDGAGRAELFRHPTEAGEPLRPGFASTRQATVFAETLASAAGSATDRTDDDTAVLPPRVDFSSLPQDASSGAASLAACLGVGPGGPETLDLVADGPHAVVGGTTGSGKSELLVTWVLAIAATHGPDAVTFLLVDFKGGAAFAPLRGLPHVVGTVTDLDDPAAARALESLTAELRHREAYLADRGARSIQELAVGHGLARLVIVVDEFAALTSGFPALHELFADLASRGRSLGVHLILCTQRPAGSVRDAVLANCTLRVSLRVNNRADSVAVIGAPDAAELPRNPAGRAFISCGEGPRLVQLALAGAPDADRIARRWHPAPPVRRPWLDPLPARLEPGDVPASDGPGLVFGLVDRPERQAQEPASYVPAEHGHLLVTGGRGSGKSGTLAAIAAATPRARWVPTSVEGSWDVVTACLEEVRSGPCGAVLLLDDVDVLLGRYPSDHRAAFVDALAALHREGPASGVHVVTSSSAITPLTGLCETKLVLRMPDRHDHAATGSPAGYDPALPPGGGFWFGSRVQVVLVPSAAHPQAPPMADLLRPGPEGLAVVSSSPGAVASRLGELGQVHRLGDAPAVGTVEAARPRGILLGDPDDWTASWTLLAALRPRVPILFHACSITEYRTLSRRRELPPPLAAPQNTGWLLHPDGRVERVRI